MMNIENELGSGSVALPVSIWMMPAGLAILDVAVSADQHDQQEGTYDLGKDTLQEDLEDGGWIREDSFDNLSFLADCTPDLLDESSHPRFRFGCWCIRISYCFPSNHQHLKTTSVLHISGTRLAVDWTFRILRFFQYSVFRNEEIVLIDIDLYT